MHPRTDYHEGLQEGFKTVVSDGQERDVEPTEALPAGLQLEVVSKLRFAIMQKLIEPCIGVGNAIGKRSGVALNAEVVGE